MKSIKTVCCVGAGLIGSGWAAHFLRAGLNVRVYDQDPARSSAVRGAVDSAWPTLEKLGLAQGASVERLSFWNRLDAALEGAQFVQESATENEARKIELLAAIDRLLPAGVPIASSSSGFLAEVLRRDCVHGERVLIGHPFNPPYLIPLVEIAGGDSMDREVLARAMEFYSSIGSRVVVLQKEIRGYIANRIQSAVFREVMYMASAGIASVADIDTAMTAGPGLRWACMGPSAIFFLGAGDPTLHRSFVELLVSELEAGHTAPADFQVSSSMIDEYVTAVAATTGKKAMSQLALFRDDAVFAVRTALDEVGGRQEAGSPDAGCA
jgi:carnitine 3-dehydrogenase